MVVANLVETSGDEDAVMEAEIPITKMSYKLDNPETTTQDTIIPPF